MNKDLFTIGLIYSLTIIVGMMLNTNYKLHKQYLATLEAKEVAIEYYEKYMLYEEMVISLNKDYEEERRLNNKKDNDDKDVKRIIKELERIWQE